MGRSQGISTFTTTAKASGFRLSRYQWLALIRGRVGGDARLLGRPTFLPGWNLIHQPSSSLTDHRDVGTTVSYAFILMMIGATLGYRTLIWMLEALARRTSYFIFSPGSLVVPPVSFMTAHPLDGVLWIEDNEAIWRRLEE